MNKLLYAAAGRPAAHSEWRDLREGLTYFRYFLGLAPPSPLRIFPQHGHLQRSVHPRCALQRTPLFQEERRLLRELGVSPFFHLLPASCQRAGVSLWSRLGEESAGGVQSVTPSGAGIAPTLGLSPGTGPGGPISNRLASRGPATQPHVCPGERRPLQGGAGLCCGTGADGGPRASADEGEVSPVQEAGPLGLGKAPLAVERRGSGGQLLPKKPLRDPLLEIIRRKVIIV